MKKIDLTMPLNEKTPSYTKVEQVSITQDINDAFIISTVRQSMHTGTHIDTPLHMKKGTKTIMDYPLTRFYGRALVFDVVGQNPITHIDNQNMIQPGDIILLKTGYTHQTPDYPVISEPLAHTLIAKQINMIGLDTPSPDFIPFPIHHLFFKHDILILENLVNLQALPINTPFTLEAYPVPYDLEAALTRVIASIEND